MSKVANYGLIILTESCYHMIEQEESGGWWGQKTS